VANDPSNAKSFEKFSPNFTSLVISFISGNVRLVVSICFSRLRKSRGTDLFIFLLYKLKCCPNVLRSHLKHFEVSVPQLKKSKCMGLTKKNASLDFSH